MTGSERGRITPDSGKGGGQGASELKALTVRRYIDSFIEENELIIVLEWAEKGDLKQLLSSRKQNVGQPFTEQEVWMYFVQICDALKHMHARRMMHRDLKPSNILVTAAGELK
eukprot:jgi/Tetstr1/438403/TSEL_026969.t1